MTDDRETPPSAPRDPEPKIYAPLLLRLEHDHPALAARLVGVGDRPYEFDGRKRLVSAVFSTDAGTEVRGRYLTEGATADGDARTFLEVMARKVAAATEADRRVLSEPPAPPPAADPAPPALPASRPPPASPPPEDDEHDDPEPAPPPEDADG